MRFGLFSSLAFLFHSTAVAQQVVRVRYGYFAEGRPIHAACARGWLDFDDNSTQYQVTCYPQSSGGFAASRLDNSELDLALLGSTPMAQAAARGIPLSVIYISHFMGDSQGIYVRDSDEVYQGVANPFDLKGRVIATPFGSTMHYQVLYLLDLFGLTGEVDVVDMSPAEIIQAWDDGQIDAAGCWGEARDYLLKNAGEGNTSILPAKTLMSAGVLADWGRPTFVVLAARPDFAEAHQAFVTHFVAVLSRINDSYMDRLGENVATNVVRWNAQGVPEESHVPSMTDALMKAGQTPGSPSQSYVNQQRRALDLFIQQTADEQLSCNYLQNNCNEPTGQHINLRETAQFLSNQKVIESLGIFKWLGEDTFCEDSATLCGSTILDSQWLEKAYRSCTNCYRVGPYTGQFASTSSLLEELERLDAESGRSPFASEEIGRAGLGERSRGDSICGGHSVTQLSSNSEQQELGDGANATDGRSYSDELDCSWEIRAPGCTKTSDWRTCDVSQNVVLDWQNVRVWSGDYIRVYTDPDYSCTLESDNKVLLAQLSGFYKSDELPPIVAKGCILLEFTTDANQERSYGDVDNTGDGFSVRISSSSVSCSSSEECNCIGGGYPSWGPTCTFKDFCLGTSYVSLDNDGWVNMASDGRISSESELSQKAFPEYYPNDLDCIFELHAESEQAFVEVEVSYDLEATHDLLELQMGAPRYGNVSPYAILTGSSEGAAKETYYIPTDENGVASLHFRTDVRGRRKGFYARARSVVFITSTAACAEGFSGVNCEIPHCISHSIVSAPKGKRHTFDLGRVISQRSSVSVRAMPWAPTGGCTWSLNLATGSVWSSAVAIRLQFLQALDLESYPESSVGDSLVIRTQQGESKFFVEKCDSDEMCSNGSWQTGECIQGACAVRSVMEVDARGANSAEAILITDRNDGGVFHIGLDFEARLVQPCPKQGTSCEDLKDAKCVEGFCVCKDSIPCACPCGAKVGKINTGLAVGIVVPLFIIFVGVFCFYRRKKILQSRLQKDIIQAKEQELEAFRNSVVGMRVARRDYVPTISLKSQETERAKSVTGQLPIVAAASQATWCWRETSPMMSNHEVENCFGDPIECWIRYGADVNAALEAAFVEQVGTGTFSPLKGYSVNFTSLVQTKNATGFQREVQRIVDIPDLGLDTTSKEVDLDKAQVGNALPPELNAEPQMVLVAGDIVQISTQRNDGWAFGTKLYHQDDVVARELVRFAVEGVSDEEANIFSDTGWFEISATDIPSGEDLANLQDKVGNTDALACPSNWGDVTDPTIVEMCKLEKDNPERIAVIAAFMSTLKASKFKKQVKVVEVKRIMNLAMWQSYVVKRQTICYRERETGLKSGDEGANADAIQQNALERFERRWLWHGTNAEVMDKIMQQGFNRSFCGKNATIFGKGVYFARDASYSAHPTYSVPDKNNCQYVMACRVVVGEYCRGHPDALTPDVRDAKSQSLYDTTVGLLRDDNMSKPSIYVTYHDSQAYPDYLIKFRSS